MVAMKSDVSQSDRIGGEVLLVLGNRATFTNVTIDKNVRRYDANSTLAPFRLHHVIYSIQLVYHAVNSILNHDMFSLATELRLLYELLKVQPVTGKTVCWAATSQPSVQSIKGKHSNDSMPTVRIDIKYTDLHNHCCKRLDALLKSEKAVNDSMRPLASCKAG